MKLITLILGSFFCATAISQKEVKTPEKSGVLNIESTEKGTPSNEFSFRLNEDKLATKKTDAKTVAYYDEYILAIETKIEYIKNTPSEDASAKESGWYDQMENYLVNAKAERAALISKGK